MRLTHGWAEVGRTTDELSAEVLAAAIRDAEMEASVLSQVDHANVVGLGGLAVVRVLVPAFQFEEARRVVERLEGEDRWRPSSGRRRR